MKSVLIYAVILGMVGLGLLVASVYSGIDVYFTEGPAAVLQNNQKDPDNDGLTNAEERNQGTDPNKSDSDGDDLLDGEEMRIYKTNPLNSDTDSDSYSDGMEIKNGYDPNRVGVKLQP